MKVIPKSKLKPLIKSLNKKSRIQANLTLPMKVFLHFYEDSMTTSGRNTNLTAKKTKLFVLKPAPYDIARVEQGECELPNT